MDERPDSDVFVPTTLEDFQTLLDNYEKMSVTPALGELSADNYYLVPSFWELLSTKEKNAYIWTPDTYNGEGKIADWNSPYEQILYTNVVLDGLKKVTISPGNRQQWEHLKGAALFIRAYAFYNLAQVFALPYDAATANTDLGIPLKLTPNVDEPIKRSTLEQTYLQILNDLKEATELLPDSVSDGNRNRPSKPAAYAQLARVYLSMRQYANAGLYADSSLQYYSTLINYNTRDVNAPRPFDRNNPETMYQSRLIENNVLKGGTTIKDIIVDTALYRSYATNDLRRVLFFSTSSGNPTIKGSYNGTIFVFTGLATDEMYLVRAECRARTENIAGAMNDLNHLLQQRWKTNTYVPYTAQTANEALNIILQERRKEMPFRGVRWTDIRRLNLESAGIIPRRKINNQVYTLPVNSPLYALPIPPDVTL
ncbi:RagB/SusD family nutrient uptake outer membrane protein [Niastella caeni]|uniref:RagB/SusD family nutrient uptake outer membrane protein n=1 Tax=Niastella caeni TaxID=2569763 RepID=UPI00140DD9B8|nr:RagB/SusD family nutrient uptake outer membrane protein [Niastella caeni]